MVDFIGKIYIFLHVFDTIILCVDCQCNLGTILVPLMIGECQS